MIIRTLQDEIVRHHYDGGEDGEVEHVKLSSPVHLAFDLASALLDDAFADADDAHIVVVFLMLVLLIYRRQNLLA